MLTTVFTRIVLLVAMVVMLGIPGLTPSQSPESSANASELPTAFDASANQVRLPDEPGTVPLREVRVQALEDTEPEPQAVPQAGPVASDLPDSLPPLSLQDCVNALQWAQKRVADSISGSRPAEPLLNPLLNQILGYLRIVDERQSSLAHYRWIFIEQEKVDGSPLDEDTFDDGSIDDVSAVALDALGGDVLVCYVAIRDDDGEILADYSLDPPVLLRAGLPRREVFHLYFPSRIEKVVVRYGEVNPAENARVNVYAGITREREYLKQAQFYLRRAKEALDQMDLQTAENMLASAVRRIERFQRKR